LNGAALVGLVLPLVGDDGAIAWARITSARVDEKWRDVYLYTLDLDGANPCGPGIAGTFVPGVWNESGARQDRMALGGAVVDTTYSCTTGALAKCELLGYRPWTAGPDQHQACTRMIRADYCGDGTAHTENGTTIDVFDVEGVQRPTNGDGLSFEAGWGPQGAICVSEPRYRDPVQPSCWQNKPSCSSWTEARALGARLGNDSAHLSRQ